VKIESEDTTSVRAWRFIEKIIRKYVEMQGEEDTGQAELEF